MFPFPDGKIPFEPGGNARTNAAFDFEYFQAHMAVGFTEDQSMELLKNMQHALFMGLIIKGDESE